jgi:hypothetical protein
MPNPSGSLVLAPTADPRVFVAPNGQRLSPPEGWICLPPGDAAITRKVKLAGPSWAVLEKRGRKLFSRGLWAPRENVERARAEVTSQRETPEYAKTRAQAVARRDAAQTNYVVEFQEAVMAFLAFAPYWRPLALELAKHVAAHATPVGSGTVARTKRIPVEERASAAVIAWMRHQTTAYDSLSIARVKGERRAVRRALAEVSRSVLDLHRRETPHTLDKCPLCYAIVARTKFSVPIAGDPDAIDDDRG